MPLSKALLLRAAWVLALIVILGAGILYLRGPAAGEPSKRLGIGTNLFPLYDWAQQVAGPDADVHLLSGKGPDPHQFSPSMEDILRIGRSRALLVIGLGLDPWTQRAIQDASSGARTELLEAGLWVERRKLGAAHEHEGHDHGHDHEGEAEDPHIWLDPARAARIVRRLGEEFARLDPERESAFRARAAAYAAKLDDLAREFDAQAGALAGKKIVTLHDAYGYLLDRCKMELAGVVQTGAGVEPSLRDVSEAAHRMRAIGQRVVFAEPGKEAAAKAIAGEIGGVVAVLDPLESSHAPFGETYIERMRYNMRTLLEHMK